MQKIHGVGRESPFQMTEVSVLSISVQASGVRPGAGKQYPVMGQVGDH